MAMRSTRLVRGALGTIGSEKAAAAAVDTRPGVQRCVRAFSSAPAPSTDKSGAAQPKHAKPIPVKADKAGGSAPLRPSAAKPVKNLRDVMDALDIMIEEAQSKMVKKYRPNMFAEFKELNDTNGKVLDGANELLAVDKAAVVPALAIKSLDGVETDLATVVANHEATLLVTSFKNFGMAMLPAWREPFQLEFARELARTGGVQVVTLNIIEDWYMKLVQGSIERGLKTKTPAELHSATYAKFGWCDDFRTTMDLYNSFVGYVHLIDSKGRTRWIAGGPATPEELERLMKVTKELLAQQKQSQQRRR